MPRFVRTTPAPTISSSSHQAFRPHVRLDFERHCAYCLLRELLAGGEENFELDHFKPVSRFPAERLNFYNLYYACHPCNHIKHDKWPALEDQLQNIGFVDLCAAEFEDHFREEASGHWRGLSASANYTIDAIRLNRSHLVEIRKLVSQLGPLLEGGDGAPAH